jgi:hypothetical protein
MGPICCPEKLVEGDGADRLSRKISRRRWDRYVVQKSQWKEMGLIGFPEKSAEGDGTDMLSRKVSGWRWG